MKNGIFIIAHAPLASALRQCVLHVFPDLGDAVAAFDVQPNVPPEESLAIARQTMSLLNAPQSLILTDMFGATPSNVAQKLIDGTESKLIAGVNLPMLLRIVNYSDEPMDALAARALAGGTRGIMQVATTAPQNQVRKNNEQSIDDHQQ